MLVTLWCGPNETPKFFFVFLDQKLWWLWRWERIKGKAAALFPNRFPGGDLPHHALLSSAQPSYHLHHQLANSIINIAITIPILTMYSPSSPLFDGRWINSYLIKYFNQLLLMAAKTPSNHFSRQMGPGPTVCFYCSLCANSYFDFNQFLSGAPTGLRRHDR